MVLHVVTSLLGEAPLCNSLRIVYWNFTRRDHPGDPRRVSGSGPVSLDMINTNLSNMLSCISELESTVNKVG